MGTYSKVISTSTGDIVECQDKSESCITYSQIPSQVVNARVNFSKRQLLSSSDSVSTDTFPRSYVETEPCERQDNDALSLQNNTTSIHTHSAYHTNKHPGEKHPCPYCSKTFSRSNDLTRHLRLHTGDQLFSCSHCHKSFARRDHLERHELTHTGERPYSCSKCGKTF